MAIHIDIYAHLREQRLIKEGEKILQLVDHYTDEANRRAAAGAQGRSKKIVASEDKVAAAFDRSMNKIDDHTAATLRLERAEASVIEIENRLIKTVDDLTAAEKDWEAATGEVARARKALIYTGQAVTKQINDETRATADLNDENAKYTKNAREVTKITKVNRKEITQLSRVTNKLRRETESLHSTNLTIVQDNKGITKSMEVLADATKKTERAREAYNETRKKDGVTSGEIKRAGRVLKDALEAEGRKARDVSSALVELIEHRRDHDNFVNQNAASLDALAVQTGRVLQESDRLRASHKATIDQSLSLTRGFDQVGEATNRAYREYVKFDAMAQDVSVSEAALRTQFQKTSDAFAAQAKSVSSAKKSLEDYYAKVDEAEKENFKKRQRALLGRASLAQNISRNIGALTPLGTLSPSALIPVAAILGTIGEAAVTASQSLALLPAAGVAAAAGIGTLVIGLRGFGDALGGMGDPKKFAEALYLLSPNAQQAALSIKQLVDGPLGDLKRATQDALFADVGVTIQKLTGALGPAIQRMTTSIATSFNQMFTGISFDMMTPDMQARFGTITTNISAMFDRMVPAITAFNSAFMKIAETGSGFLPQIADALANVMNKFDAFITRAQNDGSLQNFMSKGIDSIAAISKFLLDFGQDIYEVFGNKSPEEFIAALDSLRRMVSGLFEVFRALSTALDTLAPAFNVITDAVGGVDNALKLAFAAFVAFKGIRFAMFLKEAAAAFDVFGTAAAKAGGVGMAGAAAGAKSGSGALTGVFATAGKTASKGFGGALSTGLKSLPLIGIGVMIADQIGSGIRDGAGGWRDIVANALDPAYLFNPVEWQNAIRSAFGKPRMEFDDNGFLIPDFGVPASDVPVPYFDEPGGRRRPQDDRNPFRDRQLRGVDPQTGLPLGPPLDPVTGLPVQLDANGQAMSESDILNMYRGQLPPESYAVDPFTDPITGQKTAPMLPIGPNGIPEYPTGGVPGTPSIQGPTMPQYNSFGQVTGYGANMVDPEAVFDAQLAVQDKARDVEEAIKDVLAARQANVLSAEEVNDLERKVLDEKMGLHKSLVQLGKAQTGDVEKLKTATSDAANALGDFGAGIDKDFGISKGLSGIAENLTKFLANLAFAPAYGAMRGAQAALGFPGGEGTGHGLMGAMAAARGYYRGGPMDTGGQQASGVPAGATSTPTAPSMGAPNLALNPNNTSTAGLKPQSMALLSLIQGMPQFANVKLGSAKIGREGDDHPWHPNGQGLDFSLNANDPKQSAQGDLLKAFLESNKAQFGINHVLWKTMQGGNHFDHLHVGLNGSGNGKPDTSPLLQGVRGVVPPPGGASGVPSLASLSSGIPIPLPVTIVGGMTGGLPALPGITPPAGAPGATPPAPGATPWLAGQGPPPAPTIPAASRPAGPPTGKPGWTYGSDGQPRSAPAGSGDALFNDLADWYRSRGLEPPPAYRKYGTKVPTPPVQGPPSVPMPPMPPMPGYATGGEVPIMAHSGEHVLTREDVAALGGQAGVYNFRRSLQNYQVGGAVPRAPFSTDPFDPSNIPTPPSAPPNPKDIIRPTDLGSLLGVGDSPPAAPAPKVPTVPAPTVPEVPVISAPVVPVPAVPTLPETVLPPGTETPGSVIGAQAEAPAGYGGGFDITGGGLAGLAQQGLMMAATSGAGMAGAGGGGGGGMGAGSGAASAIASLGMETAIKLGQRGIEYGAQVAGIATQGLLETFLPAGGSELASNNWLTRLVGGVAGAAPAMANLAGGAGASNQSALPGVGAPTPEQIAAQGMDPNRAQHTGAGAPAGPVNNIGVQIMEYRTEDNRPASQDFGRYAIPGQR